MIQRFDQNRFDMEPDKDGEYVLYSDYAEARADLARLKEQLRDTTDALGEVLDQYEDPSDVGWRKRLHGDSRTAYAAADALLAELNAKEGR